MIYADPHLHVFNVTDCLRIGTPGTYLLNQSISSGYVNTSFKDRAHLQCDGNYTAWQDCLENDYDPPLNNCTDEADELEACITEYGYQEPLSACIHIRAIGGLSDHKIILDCQGHKITTDVDYGILVYEPFAVYISSRLNVPLIPVHHSVAHIEIAKLYSFLEDPLVIYVSGGNTQLLIKKENSYIVLGETLDVGLGNAIDNVARNLELEVAHGGTIEKLALKGEYIELPYVVKGMDFSFTGIVTKISQIKYKHEKKDLAYSLQETSFSMLCEAAERALMITKKREVLLCGGVAQNKRLQEMVSLMCEENNVKFGVAPDEFNRDNGGMISYLGYLSRENKMKENEIKPKYRIEEFHL